MKKVSVIRPANDRAAIIFASWGELILQGYSNRSTSLLDSYGKDVTRASVELRLAEHDALFFFGHGRPDALLAGDPVVDQVNIGLGKGRLLVALACDSLLILGKAAISSGVVGYLGFNGLMGTASDRECEAFGKAAISGIDYLLRGYNLSQAAGVMRDRFEELSNYYQSGGGKNHPSATPYFLLAYWNKGHIDFEGEPMSKL